VGTRSEERQVEEKISLKTVPGTRRHGKRAGEAVKD